MKIFVEIEWDTPEDRHWLCPENIRIALSHYCPNTRFRVSEFISGILVFPGTKIALSILVEYLEADAIDGLRKFLQDYPTITMDQINEVFERAEPLKNRGNEIEKQKHGLENGTGKSRDGKNFHLNSP
jgi:uncharacterized protein (DUF433 family)